ncbi:MAG TPA: hypothetical protein VGV89_10655 [Thermoplasmata archaeon]|nr:hypothetical protein [Thermoplasmata archaeon]
MATPIQPDEEAADVQEPAPPADESTSPPSAPRGGASPATIGAIAAVVIIVVIVLALLAVGIIPGLHSAGSPSSPKSSQPTPSTYAVQFNESGLPSGTSWSVTLNGTTSNSTSTTLAFTESNGSYGFTASAGNSYSAAPASGTVSVSGQAIYRSIAFTPTSSSTGGKYGVTFTESGLPSGSSWSVDLGGSSLSSTTTTIAFQEANGSYPYTVGTVSGYSASPPSGTVDVSGRSVSESVTFSKSSGAPTYSVTFTESGLTSGTSWAVDLVAFTFSSTSTTVQFNEPNGTYSYTVIPPTGYRATPSSGSVMVAGGPASVSITFTGRASPSGSYNVTFHETGLAPAGDWAVYLTGNASPIEFASSGEGPYIGMVLPNGTYTWFVASLTAASTPTTPGGTFTVAGAAVEQSVTFGPVSPPTSELYPVTFRETGLAPGTNWSVIVDFNVSLSNYSTTSSLVIMLPNGSDVYVASAVGFSSCTGYSPCYAGLTISAAPVSVAVTFLPTYPVRFTESGLPSSDAWAVSVLGTLASAGAGSPIVVNETNYSYSYVIPTYSFLGPLSYTPNPASGSFTISGSGRTIAIAFTKAENYTLTFSESGLPSGAAWETDISSDVTEWNGGSTSSGPIVFTLINGSYYWTAFEVSPNTSYVPATIEGWLTVSGHALSVSVQFTYAPQDRLVLVADSAVYFYYYLSPPEGLEWNLTIGGVTHAVVGGMIGLALPNGTYAYHITPPPGFLAFPSSGNLTVDDPNPMPAFSPVLFANMYLYVAFAPAPAPPILAAMGPAPAPVAGATSLTSVVSGAIGWTTVAPSPGVPRRT